MAGAYVGMLGSFLLPLLGVAFSGFMMLKTSKATDSSKIGLPIFTISFLLLGCFAGFGLIGALVIYTCTTQEEFQVHNASFAGGSLIGISSLVGAIGVGFFNDKAIPCLAKQPSLLWGNLTITILLMMYSIYSLVVGCVVIVQHHHGTADLRLWPALSIAACGGLANIGGIFGTTLMSRPVVECAVQKPELYKIGLLGPVMLNLLGIYGIGGLIFPRGFNMLFGWICFGGSTWIGIRGKHFYDAFKLKPDPDDLELFSVAVRFRQTRQLVVGSVSTIFFVFLACRALHIFRNIERFLTQTLGLNLDLSAEEKPHDEKVLSLSGGTLIILFLAFSGGFLTVIVSMLLSDRRHMAGRLSEQLLQ